MEIDTVLLELLRKELPQDDGFILALSSPALASSLQEVVPRVVAVDDLTKSARLAQPPRHSILRASLTELPAADRSLSCIVAVNALSRFADPQEILPAWSRCLRHGGKLLLVERLMQSQAMRTLHRLIEPSRHWIPPEHLTCLLLNAGFSRIGQLWPTSRTKAVITLGYLKEL